MKKHLVIVAAFVVAYIIGAKFPQLAQRAGIVG